MWKFQVENMYISTCVQHSNFICIVHLVDQQLKVKVLLESLYRNMNIWKDAQIDINMHNININPDP